MSLQYNWGILSKKVCLTKFCAPIFCFPLLLKYFLHPKSFKSQPFQKQQKYFFEVSYKVCLHCSYASYYVALEQVLVEILHSFKEDFFQRTIFFGQRKYLSKTFFRFFRISGPAGSGKPSASILGESLYQEESNAPSIMPIGLANPPTHPSHYSYFNHIWCVLPYE